ncbi:MAG: DNA polymerase III subunit alpha [Thermoanaerobaculia bacterium]
MVASSNLAVPTIFLMGFVHLHNHSDYSLLDGALRISDMVRFAKKTSARAIALTDHGNMYGIIEFLNEAAQNDVKGIPGQEFYITEGSRFDKSEKKPHYHLTILAMDLEGYKNLCKLSSKAYLEGYYYKPRIDMELLKEHNQGLIVLSGCLQGYIPQKLLNGEKEEARKYAREMREIFGKDRFYLELMRTGLPEQNAIIPSMVELSRELEIPLVATNDAHYFKKEDAILQKILICISTNQKLEDEEGLFAGNSEYYLKSTEEMYKLFEGIEEACKNTLKIAEMVNINFKKESYHLPHFEIPPSFQTSAQYLRFLAEEGLKKRLLEKKVSKPPELYWNRLEEELKIIESMNFPSYFLILQDILSNAREKGIPVGPGRGSSAGSLVAYALRIVDIDPLEYNLIFERFLNPERISMPDIDVDVCQKRRGEVLEYIKSKYGQENVCQIVTFKPLKAKGVIRDVARVLNFPYEKADKIAKLIPDPRMSIEEALEVSPHLNKLKKEDKQVEKLLNYCKDLEGLNRNISVHAAGIVITPGKTWDYAPLALSPRENEVIIQYTHSHLEKIGLLKMDILGLATLTVIDNTLKDIKENYGIEIDLFKIPLDDPEVFKLFSKGETDGIFQFESNGMKECLKKLKPTSLNDLIAMNALYRPGALGAGTVEPFIRRKNGQEKIEYKLPVLENILSETYGIIVYQEQVMQIAVEVAGYSMAKADLLRKAMGKKQKEVMQKEEEEFVKGAKAKGVKESVAREIFNFIKPFAGYGFNKSHSVSYAYLAYVTAYLKVHWPHFFMSRLIDSVVSETPKMVKYIRSAERMGIKVLPPDINKSYINFSVEENNIRFGFLGIKGVGEAPAEHIKNIRQEGEFQNLSEFLRRINPHIVNKKTMEALIKAGALDSFGVPRKTLLSNIENLMAYSQKYQTLREAGQIPLFIDEIVLEKKEEDGQNILNFEKEALGFYFSGHPLNGMEDLYERFSEVSISELENFEEKEIRVAGVISEIQQKVAKSGQNANKSYVIFNLEDMDSQVKVVAFPSVYSSCGEYIEENAVVIVKGVPTVLDTGLEIRASDVYPLKKAPQKQALRILLKVPEEMDEKLTLRIYENLKKFPGPVPVGFLYLKKNLCKIYLKPSIPVFVNPTDKFLEEMGKILGKNNIQFLI